MNSPLAQLDAYLGKEMTAALTAAGVAVPPGLVEQIAERTRLAIEADPAHAEYRQCYRELEAMAQYIRQTKQDIVAIRPGDVSTQHMQVATGELDAVVGATEEAANKIMDVCDEIGVIAADLPPEPKQKLIDCTTRIFEASNFQDLTGQRITKVIAAIKYIDKKVNALLQMLNGEIDAAEVARIAIDDPFKAADPLLNGPQMAGAAMAQDDIDRLLFE